MTEQTAACRGLWNKDKDERSWRRFLQTTVSGIWGTMRWWKLNLDEWAREVRRRIYLFVGNLEKSLKLPRKG